jgi:GR25 family glycosyltransferase involved in LPS biosynthesis
MTLFDKIYCINLDSRTDRWDACLTEFKKIGITDQVERFPAVELTPGIAGCTKSHYEIVKMAKKSGYETILILEDDISIINTEFFTILSNSITQLNNVTTECDMFYLGGNVSDNTPSNYSIDTNLVKLGYCKTTHAYVLNESIYDIIIDAYSTVDWSNNYNWSQSNPNRLNIDVWLINNIQSRGNTFGVYPCLVEQRAGFSNLVGSEMYVPMAEKWNSIFKTND